MNAPLRLAHAAPVDTPAEECEVDYGRACPTIPVGVYQAVFTHYETAMVFRTPKAFLWFRIIEPGPYFGLVIYRPYRLKALKGNPRKNGGVLLGGNAELTRMLVRVLHIKVRLKRLSPHALAGKVLRIKVRTVTTDYKQRDIPEPLRYSVVDDVVGCETGDTA